MSWTRRFRGLFRHDALDAEAAEEIRTHLDMRIADLMAEGLSPAEARLRALRAFGNRAALQEDMRAADTFQTVASVLRDVRYGLRQFRRNPLFTAVAMLTLLLGIGATSLVFSIVDTVLVRPLPFPQSNRLMFIEEVRHHPGTVVDAASYPDFFDIRDRTRTFASVASYHGGHVTFSSGDTPVSVASQAVSADFFRVLGVKPALGRDFTRADERAGRHVAVISDAFWRRRLHADPTAVGRSILIAGQQTTILGVMPASFDFPVNSDTEVWLTFAADAEGNHPLTAQRGVGLLNVIGRLRDDVAPSQAQADLDVIAQDTRTRTASDDHGFRLTPELQKLTDPIRQPLLILLAAVGLLLLIACANVANLLLARASARSREIAVRVSMGAGRQRIARQLVTESIVLWLVSGVAGLLAAGLAERFLIALTQHTVPRIAALHLDATVVVVTLGTALVTGIVFGLAPVLPVLRVDALASLKQEGRSGTAGRGHRRFREALITAQMAVALVLLVGAGLLATSYWRLLHADPGFHTRGLLTFRVEPSVSVKPHQTQVWHRLLDIVATTPGVAHSAAVFPLPFGGHDISSEFEIPGRGLSPDRLPLAQIYVSTPGYFATAGVALREGRDFRVSDDLSGPGVAIVNDAFVKQYFPHDRALGRTVVPNISSGSPEPLVRTIVGVVGDTKLASLSEEPKPSIFVPFDQLNGLPLHFVVETSVPAESLVATLRQRVASVDPQAPIYQVATVEELVSRTLAEPRFQMILLVAFAVCALLLTAIGLYGVTSYSAAQRTREVGVRMALGASRRDVLRMVLMSGARLAVIGAAVGLAGSLLVTRSLHALLYGVTPLDPLTFAAMTLLLAATATIASYVPARRASRIDPAEALRLE
ncbi:MAG TPA: ABC transporter permease [Vicinamibacterales bacterium]|nr:ABC transporter permease [Vicinamibacterales bacterium]